jgi:CIC family chloride channel protein
MTGGYQLLLPALWVCSLSFMLSDEQSIYSSQVAGRSRSPAHQGSFMREALAGVTVALLPTTRDARVLHAGDRLAEVLRQFDTAAWGVLPVVDDHHRLLGVVNLEEVYLASQSPPLAQMVLAADLMRSEVTPLVADDSLERASELFIENDLPALPLVDNLQTRTLLGLVRRSEVAAVYLKLLYGPAPSTSA